MVQAYGSTAAVVTLFPRPALTGDNSPAPPPVRPPDVVDLPVHRPLCAPGYARATSPSPDRPRLHFGSRAVAAWQSRRV